MNIVNKNQISKIVWTISILAFILSVLLFYLYFKNFNGELSKDQTDWGVFGDYVGGVIGTLFSLIAVIFSILSIYVTLKIANYIHEKEQKFNAQRLTKEIEIVHKQNRPYIYLDLTRTKDFIKIDIMNSGTGPLIIKKWQIKYKNELFNNFNDFILRFAKNPPNSEKTSISLNTAPTHILGVNVSKELLLMKPKGVNSREHNQFQGTIRNYFIESIIEFSFEDIFENKFYHSQSLSFLRN
ncbi:hypothetical protein [Leptobacterium sp. I13]|uniref:hypothetical protein n=1 Tax=Leptobacterium meishanense TaxID=3128904 RepID=UPI0030EE4AC4